MTLIGAEKFEGSAKGMEAVMRIMNVIGVDNLFDAKDKHLRVATKGWGSTIKIIGNIIDDIWFDYEAFFKEAEVGNESQNHCRRL